MSPKLVDYIRFNLARGVQKHDIEEALVNMGWSEELIDRGFAQATSLASAIGEKEVKLRVFLMWEAVIFSSFFLFMILNFYEYFYAHEFSMVTVARATAGVGSLMIGVSFALSGFAYFFDFLDRVLGYRKNIGLIGYYFALSYCWMLLYIEPSKYFYGFFENIASWDFILGLAGMAIFTFMAIISNNKAMKIMGVSTWRRGLRLGYLAIALLIARTVILEGDHWRQWLQNPGGLPPLAMLITIFAFCVILLRLAMAVSILIKNRRKEQVGDQVATDG